MGVFSRILLVVCMCMVVVELASSSRILSPPADAPGPVQAVLNSLFDVTEHGALGDGHTDDSQAFIKAWDAICKENSEEGNSILLIPAGKTYLLKPLKFQGPCNSDSVTVQIEGKLIAPTNPSDWGNNKEWIMFHSVPGLTVTGNGTIDGQGSEWWQACHKSVLYSYAIQDKKTCNNRPTALAFHHCENLKLSGLKHHNSQRNHISITRCDGATVSGLQITAPKTSPNTDGIDISYSANVQIHNCHIATGDDCIAIGTNSSNFNITGIFCGPGHGISVGSLGIHGGSSAVEEIHVSNCTFQGTENGARIKTWQGGSGYARKISFDDINLIDADHPIIINQYYTAIPMDQLAESAVKISDVTFTNFNGTSSKKDAIVFRCCEAVACENIVLEHIKINSSKAGGQTFASCVNAHVTSSDTVPHVNC